MGWSDCCEWYGEQLMPYVRRIVDDELDELFGALAAIALEGPKGVGKSATGLERAVSVFEFDREEQRNLFDADPDRLDRSPPPVLLDEWQRHPPVWDAVRRSVDRDRSGGRFLLAGSASPVEAPMHSGAGRIVRLRMRPLALAERGLLVPTVSLAALLRGNKGEIQGDSTIQLVDYANEIVASGFPGIRELPNRARTLQLDGYLARIADVEFLEQGFRLAKPASLRSWMTAYAAATATTASYASILDAATPGDSEKPAKSTVLQYREMLNRLFLLDQVPGWIPALNPLSRLAQAPKHHLVDPALAARLLGLSVDALIKGEQGASSRLPDGALLGSLFESLVALCLRVYAQPLSASVHHLRTQNGDHEVDFIIEGDDRRVVAMEVKLSPIIEDRDVVHLKWLANKLGSKLADSVVVTTGKHAYRRPDGIAVVPAALLGP
jgi:uncharacterized protein